MSPKRLVLLAGLGSAALLVGAFVFQALGYAPCQMCLWQRWPHGVAIGAMLLGVAGLSLALSAVLGALAALVTAGLGAFHTGVERGWWEGPQACSGGGSLTDLSGADLLSTEGAGGVVRCDEVAWALAGLSMASWNAVLSLCLALIWGFVLLRQRSI
ncbi:MAG: disulfide bond formation protein B [Pseudomonadota bacterium]